MTKLPEDVGSSSAASAAIVYSVDQGFLPLACMSIASIAENRPGPVPPITLLLHDVDNASRQSARSFLERLGIAFDLVEVDGSWCEPWASERGQAQAKFGILRFDDFLRQPAERVLIIDADTRFVDDIAPLLEMTLGETPLAAVDDIAVIADDRVSSFAEKLGLPPGTGYFNSGLLVVDKQRWSQQEIGQKAIAVFKERPEILTFNDQCALNAVVQGRYTKLAYRWNHLVGSAPRHWPASMFHYAGHLKPWRLQAARHVPSLRNLLPPEHFSYYRRISAELVWHEPPFGQTGLVPALETYRRLIKLGRSGRIRSFYDRQNSPNLARLASEHPALLE